MQQTRDSIADIWGERRPYVGEWPVRVDERTREEPEQWIQSACILCSNCCGIMQHVPRTENGLGLVLQAVFARYVSGLADRACCVRLDVDEQVAYYFNHG